MWQLSVKCRSCYRHFEKKNTYHFCCIFGYFHNHSTRGRTDVMIVRCGRYHSLKSIYPLQFHIQVVRVASVEAPLQARDRGRHTRWWVGPTT